MPFSIFTRRGTGCRSGQEATPEPRLALQYQERLADDHGGAWPGDDALSRLNTTPKSLLGKKPLLLCKAARHKKVVEVFPSKLCCGLKVNPQLAVRKVLNFWRLDAELNRCISPVYNSSSLEATNRK